MRQTDVVIIGAGQAGLAMSHCLRRYNIDHVVLERGQVAERWRSERWNSLRLLTPNWMSRLPGWSYKGRDPDGFMTAPEFINYLETYARASDAPVVSGATVDAVRRVLGRYHVESGRGTWLARCVVIATGHCDVPRLPTMALHCPPTVRHVTPSDYRSPDDLPHGQVLVVGASASGAQLADEIQRSGRHVTIAVGGHTRLPRLYRGRDIMWWLDRTGVFSERIDATRDLRRARAEPSMQLVGRPERSNLDLATLQDIGVHVVGRAADICDGKLYLEGDLQETVLKAQRKLERLLCRIDMAADAMGVAPEPWPSIPRLHRSPPSLKLGDRGIRTIVWATGFLRNYDWLHVPVVDSNGEIVHDGGITPSPGLYVLGLRFMRRRNSNFIDGVGADAADLSADIRSYLAEAVCAAA